MAELEARSAGEREVTVVTQNIDAHHQGAGSQDVIELHGNMSEAVCLDCAKVPLPPSPRAAQPCHCGMPISCIVVGGAHRILP